METEERYFQVYEDKPPIDELMHYGVKKRSGRYPWGSGENPYQHSGDFLSRVDELTKQGLSEKDIAESFGLSTTDYRMYKRIAGHERRQLDVDRAKSLREDGLSTSEIARQMGKNESTIRSYFNEQTEASKNKAQATAEILKQELEKKGALDIGAGVEYELGCSKGVLKEAVAMLELEGYNRFGVGVRQVTNVGKQTNVDVIARKDISQRDCYQDTDLIKSVGDYHSEDGGGSYNKIEYPQSIDSKRVYINYGDQGGTSKDGVIEIRRGVEDLDLGKSHYAQVRILVDGTHYLKGMAMYSDDIPDGCDIVFNTNKKTGTPQEKVFKPINTDDPDNPFGAAIKANGQTRYLGKDGKEHLSAINKLKEETDWDNMSKNLSSQFLSKQPVSLIKKQLNLTYEDKKAEYDDIMALENPTLKKKLLEDFATQCDSDAVHLKAAALPRQSTQVILPMPFLRDNEIYAPNYQNGEKVVLIRYPHAGTFEIPELTVNNKNAKARDILPPTVKDAVGITPKVAERLSGADFDGDQVVVIPVNDKVRIKTTKALDGLKDFDPKTEYAERPGMKYLTKEATQKEMGVVSNLITDMTLRGAPESDIVRAVKHSMVVIDAAKHKLDYKQSEKDQGIAELKQKWQKRVDEDGVTHYGGASTLISRRKQTVNVSETQGSPRPDPETGKLLYKTSGRTYVDKNGKVVEAKSEHKLLLETDDLHTLSSGTRQEAAYADYGNKLKALANEARKASLNTGKIEYSKDAKARYQTEVDALNTKLENAAKQAPRERRAQAIANSVVKAKIQDNPDIQNDKKALKKMKNIALNNARASLGSVDKETKRFKITPKEWEAIQAGAISSSKLMSILKYADEKQVREYATPRTSNELSTPRINKAKSMAAMGYTNAEIAEALGCSTSTVSKYVA